MKPVPRNDVIELQIFREIRNYQTDERTQAPESLLELLDDASKKHPDIIITGSILFYIHEKNASDEHRISLLCRNDAGEIYPNETCTFTTDDISHTISEKTPVKVLLDYLGYNYSDEDLDFIQLVNRPHFVDECPGHNNLISS